MYIPTWLIIISAIGVYFFYHSKKRQSDPNSDDGLLTMQEMWQRAEFWKQKVVEKSPLSSLEEIGSFDDKREMIEAMENDVLRLRERFKHDSVKQKQIAQDWMDYAEALQDVKSAREMLDVDWEDGAWDRFGESVKGPNAIIREVERRVEDELGDDSYIKHFNDKMKKKAEDLNADFDEEDNISN